MRKALVISLLITLLAMLHAHGQDGLRPRGDVDCDWEVSISDLNALIDDVAQGIPYHSLYTYAHDLNGDKEINIADINMLVDALLGAELPPMPSYSGTLPVLYINTEGHRDIVSKEEYLRANWWLDAMGIEGYQSIGTAQHPLGMQIKGRGNATWKYCDKKPFRLKLDEKQDMLGMPSSRHWVLLANCNYWKGEINDVLPIEIGRQMGMSWNPRIEPVEVVLNGQYIGLYFLTEKIRIAKDRVNIIEQADYETDPELITGGWLLEIDNYKEPNHIDVPTQNGRYFWVTHHSPENLSQQQRDYITQFLTQTSAALYIQDSQDRTWEKYIDIDSLAIFYIVNEIVDNVEAFSGSCFMHKQRGDSTKLVFGPFWDGGCTYYRWTPDYPFNEFIYQNYPSFSSVKWLDQIVKFEHFQQRVRYYWQIFYNEVYPTLDIFLDEFAAKIEPAGNHDYARWGQYGADNITERLNNFGRPSFHKKVAWLQSQWGNPDPIDPNPEPIDR